MADKSRHKAKVRAQILDAAAKAFRQAGTEGVSVADVMHRAGLTHGGFYAHFASRDDLVAESVSQMFADSARSLAPFFTAAPGRDALLLLIDLYLAGPTMRRPETGCPLPALCSEAHRMSPAVRYRFEEGLKRFRDAIARSVRTMGIPESERTAAALLSSMVGAVVLARSFRDIDAAEEFLSGARDDLRRRVAQSMH